MNPKYKRITKWLSKASMDELLPDFFGSDHAVIVKDGLYAIYIKKDNKLRRKEDKKLLNKLSMEDLILLNMPRKVEGIPILDMISKRL